MKEESYLFWSALYFHWNTLNSLFADKNLNILNIYYIFYAIGLFFVSEIDAITYS